MAAANAIRWALVAATWVLVGSGPTQTAAQATDCTGYDSHIWAQSVYETDPGRFAALDPDGNGLACEELPLGAAPALWTDTIPADAAPATIASITDGDTIRVWLDGRNEPVRLILIDTPETRAPNSPVECFGHEATAYLTWLLSLGGRLYLETDITDRDRYDRLLRYVWLDFGGGEVYLVNEAMARSGYASQSTYPPDVKYEPQIREAAAFAREHGYGLWSGCVTDAAGDTNEIQAPPDAPASAPVAPAAEPGPGLFDGDGNPYDACAAAPVVWENGILVSSQELCEAYVDEVIRQEILESERHREDYEDYIDYHDHLDECLDGGCDPAEGPRRSG